MLIDTKTILTMAQNEGYGVGAFNIYNLEGAAAVVQSAEEMRSPVMLQLLPSALQIGGKPLVSMCLSMAEVAEVPVALHLDHCPVKEIILDALECGISSIMADGSDLSYEDNVNFTEEIVKITLEAHKNGAVEAELGKLSGIEDGCKIDTKDARLTIPEQALEFAEKTGVTALAVCIGNIHGKYPAPPQLDFDRLSLIAEQVSIPLVLHGTSGLPDEMITKSIELGVCKFNVNTEIRSTYLNTMQNLFLGTEKVELIDLMRKSIDAMKDPVRQKIQLFCSADRA